MAGAQHDWIVFHRLRFPETVDGKETTFAGPAAAAIWNFGPENSERDEKGLLKFRSDAWGGISVFQSREAAEAVVAEPSRHLPFYTGAVASWTALLLPFTHRGEVNFRGYVEADTAIRPADHDPGGPLVVLTTSGYDSLDDPETIQRIIEFLAGISAVLRFYATLDGNIRRGAYKGFDEHDGMTCSLWRDDSAMRSAAYGPGVHREQLKRNRRSPMIDRSSFTRTRVLASSGTWNGDNPVSFMGQAG